MIGKMLFAVGIMLTVLGVALVFCSMPILSYTREEIRTHPAVQHSEAIIDYTFELATTSIIREVPFQCSPNQTVNIVVISDGGKQFTVSIRSHLSTGDALYLDLGSGHFFQTSWEPNSNGNYYLRFQAIDSDIFVRGNVTKTWTEPASNYTVSVTEQKSVLDPGFYNLGLATALLGLGILLAGASILYKQRSKFHLSSVQP
jgi:hypothetical protein